jgi:hypothetical protein
MRAVTGLPLAWLVADVAAGALGMLVALWLFPSLVNRHVAQLFDKVAQRLPSPTGWWLQKFLYRGQVKRSI